MTIPLQNIAKVAAAYSNAAKGGATSGLEAVGSVPAKDTFANLVRGSIQGVIDAGNKSEALSIKAINGTADINQVVTAVSEAEITLQTVVAIRDKVIDAYREIVRMPM